MRVGVIIVMLLGATADADAPDPFETPHGTSERGTKLFVEGRALMTQGNAHEACRRFAESWAIEPAPGTELNLANCRELEGEVAEAWSLFLDAAKLLAAEGDADRATFAAKRAAALEDRLATVTIKLEPPIAPNTTVTIDGRLLTVAPQIIERVQLGERTIAATGPTGVAATKRLTLMAGNDVTLTVPPLNERPRYRSTSTVVSSAVLIVLGGVVIAEGANVRSGGLIFLGAIPASIGIIRLATAKKHRVTMVPMATTSTAGLSLVGRY